MSLTKKIKSNNLTLKRLSKLVRDSARPSLRKKRTTGSRLSNSKWKLKVKAQGSQQNRSNNF